MIFLAKSLPSLHLILNSINMKRKLSLFTFAFLSIFTITNGQKSSLILRGGLNVANVTISENGRIDDAKTLTSFQAGFIGDISLGQFVSLQPGLLVTGKGSKTQSGETTDANYFKATSNPIYLEVPLNLVFKFGANDGPNFFAGAGPYLAIGIAGKNKTEGKIFGTAFSSENNIDWSNDDPTTLNYEEGVGFGIMKRFDYGLNGTAGMDLKKAVLSVNYGLGLAKLQSGSDNSDDNNKHRVLSFTIGFKL
jgi:hypothetical protein